MKSLLLISLIAFNHITSFPQTTKQDSTSLRVPPMTTNCFPTMNLPPPDTGRISKKDYNTFMKLTSVKYQTSHIAFRELTYSDFKGHGTSAAHIVTNIDLIESETDGRHRFYIRCYFVPSESWINVKTPAVLLHEQYHFTISAAYAHHLKEILYRFQDCDSLTAIAMHNHYNQQMDAWRKEQQDYDDATNHGIDTTAQKNWQLRIDKEMQK